MGASRSAAIEPETHDELIRARLASTWSFRTRAEIEASARFARLADELEETGAAPAVVRGAREASADEARHRDLCARMAEQWGDRTALTHVAPRVRIGRSDMDPRDRLLWEMVSVCCLGETMNTSLMTRCLEVAKDRDVHATLHELLKDEVRHARLGWTHLADQRSAGRGDFLAGVLPLILEASVDADFLAPTAEEQWTDALYDYGELPRAELRQIFRDTLNLVVLKGLDSLGIDTAQGRAWLATKVPG